MAHNPSIMSIAKIKRPAMAIALAIITYTQPATAEDFTGRNFLLKPQSQQFGFIGTSIGMASMIAGQKSRAFSDCIAQWYWEDPRGTDARNREIVGVMAKLPDYSPTATVFALIEKACGKFY